MSEGISRAQLFNIFRRSATEEAAPGFGFTNLNVTSSCTSCGACVKACPHQALRLDGGVLSFKAASCSGCALCVRSCPPKAITLQTSDGTSPEAAQFVKIHVDDVVNCQRCGKPMGSRAMMRKVADLMGWADIDDICPSCKLNSARL